MELDLSCNQQQNKVARTLFVILEIIPTCVSGAYNVKLYSEPVYHRLQLTFIRQTLLSDCHSTVIMSKSGKADSGIVLSMMRCSDIGNRHHGSLLEMVLVQADVPIAGWSAILKKIFPSHHNSTINLHAISRCVSRTPICHVIRARLRIAKA